MVRHNGTPRNSDECGRNGLGIVGMLYGVGVGFCQPGASCGSQGAQRQVT